MGAGDIASCLSEGDEATAELLDAIPGTVFTLGDNVYESGSDEEFALCYDLTWGRHRHRTRPSVGNHEYNTPNAAGYYRYFGAPAGDADKGYYSYDAGVWRVIVLNSFCSFVGGCEAAEPQGRWLAAELSRHRTRCTLAYWHHPLFTSGAQRPNAHMRAAFTLLYNAGADLVLNGHDHNYERFAPQDPLGRPDPRRGIREIVVGTGGKSHIPLNTPAPNSEVRNDDTYGVLRLTLLPTSYEWEFVPVAGGRFTDAGSSPCH